jgi:hypothetical protein
MNQFLKGMRFWGSLYLLQKITKKCSRHPGKLVNLGLIMNHDEFKILPVEPGWSITAYIDKFFQHFLRDLF